MATIKAYQPITSDVFHCRRCGQNHDGIVFARFRRPIVDADGTVWERWGMCPTTDEPILLSAIVHPTQGN